MDGDPNVRQFEPCHDAAAPDPSAATGCVESSRGAPVGLLPERRSLPRAVAFNVRRRGAEGDIVASGCLHDSPDRVHNDLWLVDRHDVTGLLSDHQTSSF